MASCRVKRFAKFSISVLVTSGLLYYSLSRLSAQRVFECLTSTRWGWFLAGFLLFSSAIVLGAARWHLALKLCHVEVHSGASLRAVCCSYWGYLAGALAGDGARAAIYSRMFGFTILEIAPSIVMDRLMGMIGLVLLLTISPFVSRAILSKTFSFPLIIATLLFMTAFFRTRKAFTLQGNIRNHSTTPRLFLFAKCVLLSIGTQLLVAIAFCFNLLAVDPSITLLSIVPYIPWVMLCGAIPFAVAGLGVRESAAIYFLGLAGVQAEQSTLSSLLFFLCVVGASSFSGLIWFWNSQRKTRTNPKPLSSISVVVPVLNEQEAIGQLVSKLLAFPEVSEVIVVDGGSSDATMALALAGGARVLSSNAGRGLQLRMGANVACGDIIWMVHADTILPMNAAGLIIRTFRDPQVVGGGFWKTFRERRLLLHGSRARCFLRLFLFRRVMADQAIFVCRKTLEKIGGIPPVPLMEEFELCRLLRKEGVICLAGATVFTSARRFLKFGIINTYAVMANVTLRYYLGESPEKLKKLYEKK